MYDQAMDSDRNSGVHLARAIAELRRAYQEAHAAITAEPDPHRAFELATDFANELRSLADDGANLRAVTVGRIWEAEAISLAQLAQKIGVSKARAGQLMQSARAAQERMRTNEKDA
ncbi:MAG: hypothetical protein ACRDTF_10890 [Pseudonocardiaceae bacterium]